MGKPRRGRGRGGRGRGQHRDCLENSNGRGGKGWGHQTTAAVAPAPLPSHRQPEGPLGHRRIVFHPSSRPDTGFKGDKGGTAGKAVAAAVSGGFAVKRNGKAGSLSSARAAADKALGFGTRELFAESTVMDLLVWKKVERIGPGLHNLGNTCFLNSTLQCLLYVPPLSQHFLTSKYSETGSQASRGQSKQEFCKRDPLFLFERTVSLVHGVGKAGGKVCYGAVSPKAIVSNIKLFGRQFRVGRQEDAHEFLRYLVEGLAECYLKRTGVKVSAPQRFAETTAIHRIFGGYLRSQVMCSACGYCSDTFDPFMDLSLEIDGGVKSIGQALARFSVIETLDSANRWKCGGCRRLVRAKKQLTVFKSPNALVLQLKRFKFGRHAAKLKRPVAYPENLTLDLSGPEGKAHYELTGVLVHVGESMNSGHYYSFVRGSNKAWYHMDDAQVHTVSKQVALNQKAYVLFYTRKHAVEHLQPQPQPPNGTAATTSRQDLTERTGTQAVTKEDGGIKGNGKMKGQGSSAEGAEEGELLQRPKNNKHSTEGSANVQPAPSTASSAWGKAFAAANSNSALMGESAREGGDAESPSLSLSKVQGADAGWVQPAELAEFSKLWQGKANAAAPKSLTVQQPQPPRVTAQEGVGAEAGGEGCLRRRRRRWRWAFVFSSREGVLKAKGEWRWRRAQLTRGLGPEEAEAEVGEGRVGARGEGKATSGSSSDSSSVSVEERKLTAKQLVEVTVREAVGKSEAVEVTGLRARHGWKAEKPSGAAAAGLGLGLGQSREVATWSDSESDGETKKRRKVQAAIAASQRKAELVHKNHGRLDYWDAALDTGKLKKVAGPAAPLTEANNRAFQLASQARSKKRKGFR
ncbi:unnamed protein product [Chrysoparadoxa australica]